MLNQYSCDNEPDQVRVIAEKFGFCLVRGLFSQADIVKLEQQIGAEKENFPDGFPDLYSMPSLRWPMLDEKVRAIARSLLGPDLVYYREANIAYESEPGPLTKEPFREFHCDARGSPNNLNLRWQEVEDSIYPAYRFALYFRNYRDYSGGLKVAGASHLGDSAFYRKYAWPKPVESLQRIPTALNTGTLQVPSPPFELFNIPSVPGDLVIFNLRTFHSAGFLRFADRPDLAVLPIFENGIRANPSIHGLCLPPPPGCRNAIFFDYGQPSAQLDLYIKWRALSAGTQHLSTYDLDRATSDSLIVRNDKYIVELVRSLLNKAKSAGVGIDSAATLSDLSPSVSEDAKRLLALCVAHQEFSPFHSLFDVEIFKRQHSENEIKSLMTVVSGVSQRLLEIESTKHTVPRAEY